MYWAFSFLVKIENEYLYFYFMSDKNKQFPQYRKLTNAKSFYKILNERSFVELQEMGSRWWLYNIEAKQYPEILRIMDMIELKEPYVVATEMEVESIIELVKKNVEN